MTLLGSPGPQTVTDKLVSTKKSIFLGELIANNEWNSRVPSFFVLCPIFVNLILNFLSRQILAYLIRKFESAIFDMFFLCFLQFAVHNFFKLQEIRETSRI